jgi:hypothetical protein
MENRATPLQDVYLQYAASTRLDEPLGAVVDTLVAGSLDRASFDAIVKTYRVEHSRSFRQGLLDMILHYIRRALKDHILSPEEHAQLTYLSTTFGIKEGDFLRYRRGEVALILQGEVHRFLDDERIDLGEQLFQDELQRLFGLGYDELVELTQPAVSPVIERIAAAFHSGAAISEEARVRLERRLRAVRRVYPLTHAQRRSLGL